LPDDKAIWKLNECYIIINEYYSSCPAFYPKLGAVKSLILRSKWVLVIESALIDCMEKVASPETFIDPQLLEQLEEERSIIVHCKIFSGGDFLRIWKTTYLTQQNGSERASLLFALQISIAPQWCFIERADGWSYFTLIFETLPKYVRSFALQEVIPEPGGFYSALIQRNKTDVYEATLMYD